MPPIEAPTLGELEAESAADSMRAVIELEGGIDPTIPGSLETGEALEGIPPAGEDPADLGGADGDGGTAGADDRLRDERGRFAAKDPDPAGEPPAEGAETPAGEPEALEPSPEWSAEQHEEFRKLDPSTQKFLLDTVNAANEAAQAGDRFGAIEQLLAPRREAWKIDGLTDVQAVDQLLSLSDFAARDPGRFTLWFMQNRGLTPQMLFGQPQRQQTPEEAELEADPVYAQLKGENSHLQARLDRIEQGFQTHATNTQEQARQRVTSEIQEFGNAADERGRLSHPYFEQVKPVMGALLRSGKASDLKNAYDMACRADPEVHAKIASAQRAQEERDRQREARAKAEAASKAGSSISGNPGDPAPPEPTGDIREDMRRQMMDRGMLT